MQTSQQLRWTMGGNDNNTPPQPPKGDEPNKKRPIFSKTLWTAGELSKLLPTGTTLAFQTMAPSFTKGGTCEDHDVNFAFTWGLIGFLTLLSAALNFTDSVQDKDGHTHYGVVTRHGLWLFNHHRDLVAVARVDGKAAVDGKELSRMKLRTQDVLHAVVSAAVFVTVAFCDAGVQRCVLAGHRESRPWKDFFNHLPLAVGFLASFVFFIFPSNRKGIGADGGASPGGAADEIDTAPGNMKEAEKMTRPNKSSTLLSAVATLSKLLPTGTTLAFQTMAPSFTNGGDCAGQRVNFAFTWGLIGLLTLICAVVSFTDSVTDVHGHTYYGVATVHGIKLFNVHPNDLQLSSEKSPNKWKQLANMKRTRWRDLLHAVVSAAVFLTVAFCDAGVQGCLVPEESTQWREFLTLLPLAVAFLASFLFVIFPSDRKGIGEVGAAYCHVETTEGDNGAVRVDKTAADTKEQELVEQQLATTEHKDKAGSSLQSMSVMSITRVAPSSDGHGAQLDSEV